MGRIIPAFPGVGGGFEDGVLHAALTPRLIQPTAFGILTPGQELQAKQLKTLFRRAKIPYQQIRGYAYMAALSSRDGRAHRGRLL